VPEQTGRADSDPIQFVDLRTFFVKHTKLFNVFYPKFYEEIYLFCATSKYSTKVHFSACSVIVLNIKIIYVINILDMANLLGIKRTSSLAGKTFYWRSFVSSFRRYDCPLSESGNKEAIAAGELLRQNGHKFDIAYTSMLKRAIKTLWHSLEQTDCMYIPIVNSWRLNERFVFTRHEKSS